MARVVQRRKTFPYALIIFVALFLIAMTLLVLQYTDAQKLRAQNVEAEKAVQRLATKNELGNDEIRQMIQLYDLSVSKKRPPQTVVAQFNSKIAELTTRINGTKTTAEDAIRRADALAREIQSSQGLIVEVQAARAERRETESRLRDAEKERNAFRTEAEKLREELAARDTAHTASREDLNQQILKLQEQFGEMTREKQKQLDALKKDAQQIREEKDKVITQGTRKVRGVNEEKVELQRKVEELSIKLAKKTRRVEAAMQPDGSVVGLEQNNAIAYVNRGSRDGVEVGFTFSVFPKTGIPKASEKPEEKQRASLIVVGVGEDVSRCRVAALKSPDDPILVGDPVINVAFDSIRRWRFVVEGHFDLHGGNHPSEMGAAEVALLLRRLGSEVTPQLDYDVDFLVLGAEPAPPRQPDQEAPPQTWEAFKQAVKIRKQWSDVRNKAVELGIPIMNTNTLMALTGYTPIKALREVPR